MSVEAFFRHELDGTQRMFFVFVFVAVGLVISAQVSQLPEKPPARWARLTDESRRHWYTLYVLEAFLFVQAMYETLRDAIAEYGHDDGFLNGLWLGLLGLETLMVVGVAVQGVARRLQGPAKLKTT